MSASLIVLLSLITNALCAGFEPLGLDPISAHVLFITAPTVPRDIIAELLREYETPMAIRIFAIGNDIFWNCVAVYDDTALDILTKRPPIIRASSAIINNPSTGNPNTKLLCGLYANLMVLSVAFPESIPVYQATFTPLNFDSTLLSPESYDPNIRTCLSNGYSYSSPNIACLQNIADQNGYKPEIMASIVAFQVLDYLENDGWNAYGQINRNGDGQCTANCRPFSDITMYEPEFGDLERWQRLQEDDGKL